MRLRALGFVVVVAAVAAFPAAFGVYPVKLLQEILIWGVFAMSLDFLMGYGGMVSFGHSAFFGIGAYVAAFALQGSPGALAGLGIDTDRMFTGVFAFGAALGGLSGVIAGPIQSAYPSVGVTILIPALIVVVVGGLGSLKGSLVGSLIIGQAETFGKAWLPGVSMLMIYVVMALIVLLRPQGLFGRQLK